MPYIIVALLACIGAVVAVNSWRRLSPPTADLLSSLQVMMIGFAILGGIFALREPFGLMIALPSWAAAYAAWRRYGKARAQLTQNSTARNGSAPAGMSREEALAVLGLTEEATPDDIRAAHRRIIGQIHPDQGGSDYLAAKANQARDRLL